MNNPLVFKFDKYDLEFSFENEGQDGDACETSIMDNRLRIYCLTKNGEELASICSNLSVDHPITAVSEYANNLNKFLDQHPQHSIFRAMERFIMLQTSNAGIAKPVEARLEV